MASARQYRVVSDQEVTSKPKPQNEGDALSVERTFATGGRSARKALTAHDADGSSERPPKGTGDPPARLTMPHCAASRFRPLNGTDHAASPSLHQFRRVFAPRHDVAAVKHLRIRARWRALSALPPLLPPPIFASSQSVAALPAQDVSNIRGDNQNSFNRGAGAGLAATVCCLCHLLAPPVLAAFLQHQVDTSEPWQIGIIHG